MRRLLKTTIAMLMIAAMMLTWAVAAGAVERVDDNPQYMPLGLAFYYAGGYAVWDEENFRILAYYESDTYIYFLYSSEAFKNDEAIELNFSIFEDSGRAFISYYDAAFLFEDESGEYDMTIMTAVLTTMYLMDAVSVPGVTVALVDSETGFTWTQGFGLAGSGADGNVYVNELSLFSLASISKTFTAVSVMQLVEAGLIDLDEPVCTYLPEFSAPTDLSGEGDYRNITVRMLLSHASGLHPDYSGAGVTTINGYNTDYLNDFLDTMADLSMISPEATVFSYSNNAFNLLGILVAAVSGFDDYFYGFDSYTYANIFSPLGMNLSTFAIDDSRLPYLAQSYASAGIPDEFIYFNAVPAGGLFSNAHDMARFMQMMLGGGSYDGRQILTSDSIQQMLEVQDYNFEAAPNILAPNMQPGLGLLYSTGLDGFTHVGHSGNLVHYHSDMAFDLDSGLGVFVSTNSITGMYIVRDLCVAILETAVMEKTGVLNVPTPDLSVAPIELSVEDLQALEGVYAFAGEREFIRVELADDGLLYMHNISNIALPLSLVPLSDGSFINPDYELRIWFDEIDGVAVLYYGPYKTHLVGQILDLEFYPVHDSFDNWEGTYVAVTEDDDFVSIISHVEVGVDDNGIPFIRIFALHGSVSISPLIYIDDNNYYSGTIIEFDNDGGADRLTLMGVTFERVA